MKVLSFLGSPRKHGNTAVLMEHCIKGLIAGHPDVEIEEFFLHEMNLAPCKGCNYCKEANRGCVIKDDMVPLYEKIKRADLYLIGTPVYWWSMSAQLKAFIDRLYALDFEKDMRNKKMALLVTYGGELPNSGPELVEKTFRDICHFTGIHFVGVCGACTDDYLPVSQNKMAQDEAFAMGKYIS